MKREDKVLEGRRSIDFPGTNGAPWALYNQLIEGIPEDVLVTDYCLGYNWSYVNSEAGMGVAFTASDGKKWQFPMDYRGLPLRDVAKLSKSWCFEEATLGIAAINAWYNRPALLDPLGVEYDEPVELPDGTIRKQDAFELYKDRMDGLNVVMVGHFPHAERLIEYGANLTVLERRVRDDLDTPDPACEYVLPEADLAFITGVTFINKTSTRLMQMCREADAELVMVGPSVPMSPLLFDYGATMLAGSVVNDPERTEFAAKNAVGKFFGRALQMCSIRKPGA